MIWLMARAMASLTSTPGWWVPLETGFPSVGFRHEPLAYLQLMKSKNPSFLGIPASTMLASWAIVLPRVFPNVDQAWISGRLSEPREAHDQPDPVDRDGHVDVDVPVPGRIGIEQMSASQAAPSGEAAISWKKRRRVLGDRPVHGRGTTSAP